MAVTYFKGRIDFGKLSMAEISEVTAVLSTLEKMAAKEGFEFESGVTRRYAPREDMRGKRTTERPRLERRLLVTMHASGSVTFPQLVEATGMKEGSISPHLSKLFKQGLITKQHAPDQGEADGRKKETIYELTEAGSSVAKELVDGGDNLLT